MLAALQGDEDRYCTACFSGDYPVEFSRDRLDQLKLFEGRRPGSSSGDPGPPGPPVRRFPCRRSGRSAHLGASAVVLLSALGGLLWGWSRSLPSVAQLAAYSPGLITRVYDAHDQLLASFYVERREIVPWRASPSA